ncbi:MAG TPA: hypothetical protein VLE97_10705 [Gaiellaceae bacterium]|nr:hypothetical protein [Gaiellaceae bacterium]
MHELWHANEVLLTTAREYASSNATGGDVTAAAYRLAAEKLRERGLVNAATDLEREASLAEKSS